MLNQKKTIELIQDVADKNKDISIVWLYGSRATGDASEHSDFDIAIAFNNFNLSNIEKYLRPNELAIDWASTLDLPADKISIVDINQAPAYLAYNIVEYGNVIYQTQSSRLYREENRIYSQYEFQVIESQVIENRDET